MKNLASLFSTLSIFLNNFVSNLINDSFVDEILFKLQIIFKCQVMALRGEISTS